MRFLIRSFFKLLKQRGRESFIDVILQVQLKKLSCLVVHASLLASSPITS